MAISEKSRSALYQGLVPIAGEEAVGEMLSFFPARDVEEPVTKELLRAEIADVRTEIASVRTEIAELRSEMHCSINQLFARLIAVIVGTVGIAVTVTVRLIG
jgi:hypothetical protein